MEVSGEKFLKGNASEVSEHTSGKCGKRGKDQEMRLGWADMGKG